MLGDKVLKGLRLRNVKTHQFSTLEVGAVLLLSF
jgi:hypothetical protein